MRGPRMRGRSDGARFAAAKLFVVHAVAVRLPQRRPHFCSAFVPRIALRVRPDFFAGRGFIDFAIHFGEKTRDRVDAHRHIDGCE